METMDNLIQIITLN